MSIFGRKAAAEVSPPVKQVPLCVLCARDGDVEEGRLCETHLLAQEHDVEAATGLHPADLWAIRNGQQLADDGQDRRGSLVHRPELGGER